MNELIMEVHMMCDGCAWNLWNPYTKIINMQVNIIEGEV